MLESYPSVFKLKVVFIRGGSYLTFSSFLPSTFKLLKNILEDLCSVKKDCNNFEYITAITKGKHYIWSSN